LNLIVLLRLIPTYRLMIGGAYPRLPQRGRGTAEAVDEEDEFHTNYI